MLQWEKVELIAGIITSRRLEAPAPSSLEYLGHSLNLPSYQGTTKRKISDYAGPREAWSYRVYRDFS